MSIAGNLMVQLERIAAEQGLLRITRVEVVCGEMQQVVPESLHLAFDAITEDTIAGGATLVLEEESLEAVCRSCGNRFVPQIDDFLCPECRVADVEIVSGRDIVLRSIEGEARNEVSS